MEYLEELDSSAIEALTELGGDDISFRPPPVAKTACPRIRAPTSRKRRRRLQAMYLLRLEPPLSTGRDVANALGLPRVPKLETGDGEDGEAYFCRLAQADIDALDAWTAQHCANKGFTKIRIAMAHKDQILPVLGQDATLPHHRPSTPTACEPTELTCSNTTVFYFFYGTLAEPSRLSRILNFPEGTFCVPKRAHVLDGRVKIWANKYLALVDARGSEVQGWMCLLTNEDQEDALRVYEGDNYEVVRATIVSQSGERIEGRTFRFCGYDDELSR